MDNRLYGHPINKSLQAMKNEKSNFIHSKAMHKDTHFKSGSRLIGEDQFQR